MPTTRRGMREAKRLRSRRVRALLAGGLVFGVGAAMTLAAWNDSEYGTATFTAGTFGIVGATDGTTFVEHNPTGTPPSTAAALSFTVPVASMAPGRTTHALFSVKTVTGSVSGTALLTSTSPAGTGLGGYLTYGVKVVSSTVCNATTYAASTNVVVADGTAMATGSSTSQVLAANGSAQVNYCFAVTLPVGTGNAAQGLTAIQTWQVQGTST